MNRENMIGHVASIGALALAAVVIDIARNVPRVLPAFDQRFFPVLLGLLVLALPLSAWQCRHRTGDMKAVLLAYAAAIGVLIVESIFVSPLFCGSPVRALLPLLFVGTAYGVLLVTILRLARKHLWFAVTTFLLFAGTGIADLHRANRYHGSVHWILEWQV